MSEKRPDGHSEHENLPDTSEKNPAWHGMQIVELTSVGNCLPGTAPAGQVRQEVAPVSLKYVPVSHNVHILFPEPLENVPLSQERQAVAPEF